jgi:hypothetical protein
MQLYIFRLKCFSYITLYRKRAGENEDKINTRLALLNDLDSILTIYNQGIENRNAKLV